MADPRILFRVVISLSYIAGFTCIGDKAQSKVSKFFMKLFTVSAFSAMLYQSISSIYLLIYLNQFVEDGSMLVCFISLCISSCSLILYYIRKGSIIQQHFVKIVDFAENNCEGFDDLVVNRLLKYSRRLNKFLLLSIIVWFLDLFLQNVVKAVNYHSSIYGNGKGTILFYEVPFEVHSDSVYWQTLSLQTFILFCMLMTQQTHRNYLFAMMLFMALCFEYLRHNLRDIILDQRMEKIQLDRMTLHQLFLLKPLKEDYESYINEKQKLGINGTHKDTKLKLNKWVENHVRLLSLCREFVTIYTPLLITYFTVMFVILISGVFSITQNQHYIGLAEAVLLGLYFAGIIFNMFMLCIAGTNLQFESLRMFEEVFQAPWYECSPEVKSSLRIICTVSRQPIAMAAFGSDQFNISLTTFIWMMRTMASFYIALAQMKQLAAIRSAE